MRFVNVHCDLNKDPKFFSSGLLSLFPKTLKNKRYFFYLVALLFLVLILPVSKTLVDIYMLLTIGRLAGTEDWVDATLKKKEDLAKKTPPNERRILVIAGSNALLGVSAQQIYEATGIRTINLSSHAGLGGEYLLGRAEELIRSSDILLLPLEYKFYMTSGIQEDFSKGRLLSQFVVSYDRTALKDMGLLPILSFVAENAFTVTAKPEYIAFFNGQLSWEAIQARQLQQKEDGYCYSGLTINEYGDETCNVGKESYVANPDDMPAALPPSLVNIDPGNYIQAFVDSVQDKGATIIPLYPVSVYKEVYKDPSFHLSAKNIEQFWKDQGLDFRDSLDDSLLPIELMYDTPYHPKDSGRRQRTEKIIRVLDTYLSQEDLKNRKNTQSSL